MKDISTVKSNMRTMGQKILNLKTKYNETKSGIASYSRKKRACEDQIVSFKGNITTERNNIQRLNNYLEELNVKLVYYAKKLHFYKLMYLDLDDQYQNNIPSNTYKTILDNYVDTASLIAQTKSDITTSEHNISTSTKECESAIGVLQTVKKKLITLKQQERSMTDLMNKLNQDIANETYQINRIINRYNNLDNNEVIVVEFRVIDVKSKNIYRSHQSFLYAPDGIVDDGKLYKWFIICNSKIKPITDYKIQKIQDLISKDRTSKVNKL